MSRTCKDRNKIRSKKACRLFWNNDTTWMKWYPAVPLITSSHARKGNEKIIWIGDFKMVSYSYQGHGIAVLSYWPKSYDFDSSSTPSWHNTMYHHRPTRHDTKVKCIKLCYNKINGDEVIFGNHRRPHHYYW